MKKTFLLLLACLVATVSFAGNLLTEGFEYANHDFESPVGWVCDDNSWLCGYLEKDHNRIPHTGNWYAFSDADDAWMFMPMYLIQSMRYRFTLWAISDGEVQIEIWTGSAPDPEHMHTQFMSTTVSGGEYEKVSVYVETIPLDCQYFAIRALSGSRGNCLTIDDVEVDMVEQYTFVAEPITGDTAMYPGTQATFHYLVHNTGYDPVDVTMHPSNEFFTNFTCTCNGATGMTIHTESDEIVEVTMTATLRPEIEPGTVAWLDIQMTIPCNCNTAMVTFWVTPLNPDGMYESNPVEINVFPNPAEDYVMVAGEGVKQVTVYDWTGRMVMCIPVENNQTRILLEGLDSGGYIIVAEHKEGLVRRSLIKR